MTHDLTTAVEDLDLTRHTIESVAGKRITINGVEYLAHSLIGEGGQSFTFPLENLSSRICWFVAKICKWKPGTPEYVSEFRCFTDSEFELQAHGIPLHYTEAYEAHGGLIRFESNYQSAETTSDKYYHHKLMERAARLLADKNLKEAASVYQRILALNAFHSPAMINLAGCFIGLRKPETALSLLAKAHEVEPNERLLYHQSAFALVALHRPREGIRALDASLRRYRWDFETWELKAKIAAEYNLPEELAEILKDLNIMFEKRDRVESFLGRLTTTKSSAEEIRRQMAKATAEQHEGNWDAALQIWNAHRTFVDGDPTARFNVAICEYHLGNAGDVADRTPILLDGLPEMLANCCALLCLLSCIQAGKWSVAKQLATAMNELVSSPWDLPGIPQVASEYVIESQDVNPVIGALKLLQEKGACTKSERASVQQLLEKYTARSS